MLEALEPVSKLRGQAEIQVLEQPLLVLIDLVRAIGAEGVKA